MFTPKLRKERRKMSKKPKFRIKTVEYPNGHLMYCTIQKKTWLGFYSDVIFNEVTYFPYTNGVLPYMSLHQERLYSSMDAENVIKWMSISKKHHVGIYNNTPIFCFYDEMKETWVGHDSFVMANQLKGEYNKAKSNMKLKTVKYHTM